MPAKKSTEPEVQQAEAEEPAVDRTEEHDPQAEPEPGQAPAEQDALHAMPNDPNRPPQVAEEFLPADQVEPPVEQDPTDG